ncbi:uncharacterized protein BX663DRAFT_513221, partial [Cokeromyces recurvatus]|uniref:uncharacterized protein n=1 Tax=Cokeromyces recurvatus TaxID=90255 RepID=UPI00221F34C2
MLTISLSLQFYFYSFKKKDGKSLFRYQHSIDEILCIMATTARHIACIKGTLTLINKNYDKTSFYSY